VLTINPNDYLKVQSKAGCSQYNIIGVISVFCYGGFCLSWHRSSVVVLSRLKNFEKLVNLATSKKDNNLWRDFEFSAECYFVLKSDYVGFCEMRILKIENQENEFRCLLPDSPNEHHSGVVVHILKTSPKLNFDVDTTKPIKSQKIATCYSKDQGQVMSSIFIDKENILLGYEFGKLIYWDVHRNNPKFELQISKKNSPLTCLVLGDKYELDGVSKNLEFSNFATLGQGQGQPNENDQIKFTQSVYVGCSENFIFKVDIQQIKNWTKFSKLSDIFKKIEIPNNGTHSLSFCRKNENSKSASTFNEPLLISLGWDKRIRIFNHKPNKIYENLEQLAVLNVDENLHSDSTQGLVYDNRKDVFLCGSLDGRISVWKGFYEKFLKGS